MSLTAISETVHTYAIGENKVDIMHVAYMYMEAKIMLLTLSGNCATNCEFHLQYAHLQLQLQLGKILI